MRVAADRVGNDQGTDAALSTVVVRRNSWNGHKDTQFGQKAFNTRGLGSVGERPFAEPFASLADDIRSTPVEEGEKPVRFLEEDADTYEIQFIP